MLMISTVATLIGSPAVAQKTGTAAQIVPTPAVPPAHRPGPPPAPRAPAPPESRTAPPYAEETRPPDAIMDPPSTSPRPSVITNPSWAVRPMPEYPETAMAAGITSGRVVQRCVVMSTGWLRNCEIIEETPVGMGFGASALNASARARITPRTVDGNAEAAMVQFAIRYEAPYVPPIAPIRR